MGQANHTDSAIVQGIFQGDPLIIKSIYQNHINAVVRYIEANSGSREDAEDVIQDALCAIFLRIRKGDFVLTCTFQTFLFAICRKLWLKELRNRKYKELNLRILENITDEPVDQGKESLKEKLIENALLSIDLPCSKLLKLWMEGVSVSEITKIMNYSSDQHTMNRRYICTKRLINSVVESNQFQFIKNELY